MWFLFQGAARSARLINERDGYYALSGLGGSAAEAETTVDAIEA